MTLTGKNEFTHLKKKKFKKMKKKKKIPINGLNKKLFVISYTMQIRSIN